MENTTAAAPARPGLVWAIAVFYAVSALWTALAFYLLFSGKVKLTPLQQGYFETLGPLDHLLVAGSVLANLCGAAALFRLKRAALAFFAAGLALSVASSLLAFLAHGWLAAFGASGVAGTAAGWVIGAAVCVYAWKLGAAGVLE